jgi:hypothetical protein
MEVHTKSGSVPIRTSRFYMIVNISKRRTIFPLPYSKAHTAFGFVALLLPTPQPMEFASRVRDQMMTRLSIILLALFSAAITQASERQTGEMSFNRVHSKLFRHQYTIYDHEFCGSEVCVDFDNDGHRELLYASRVPGKLQLLNAADGSVRWSRALQGQQQSTSAFDLDGDGWWEVLYTVSDPGVLYVCDHNGNVLRQWNSEDYKLGNSPVIVDGDGDGTLDGYLGSRSRYMARVNMCDLSLLKRREGWVQCGCYTSAMDVDRDGRWDLFAGSGDDYAAKGVLHRLDPLTLESLWSYPTNDNASSADAVLVDLDSDGHVEIVKSIDNYKQDDAHDGILAFKTDGTRLWKVDGLSGEDSPNVADLDGDGSVEMVGMTFGGEVYCLDANGRIRWRRDLRPELDDSQHMYLTPILCDLNGDRQLEILAMTHGQYSPAPGIKANARLTALDAAARCSTSWTWASRDIGGMLTSVMWMTIRSWNSLFLVTAVWT